MVVFVVRIVYIMFTEGCGTFDALFGRVLFGGERPLAFGGVCFLQCFVMSVGIADKSVGTYLD